MGLAGKIVLLSYTESGNKLYALSLTDLKLASLLEDLPNGIFGDFDVSPNGNWLALLHESSMGARASHELILLSGDGQTHITPWDKQRWTLSIAGWLSDNQHLAIWPPFDDRRLLLERPDKIVVYNPFTHQQKLIAPTFHYTTELLFDYWRRVGHSVVYNADLSRAVYLDDEYTLVVWDIAQSRELWRWNDPINVLTQNPVWSPDGHHLALTKVVTDGQNGPWISILLVNSSGAVTQSRPLIPSAELASDMRWSPDGRYIFFLWRSTENELLHLVLWDATGDKVIDCVANVAELPVWSPAGSQFLIRLRASGGAATPDPDTGLETIIVDMDLQKAFRLPNPLADEPIAWMAAGP